MTTPRSEFEELVLRTKKLSDSVLLTFLSAALLAVAAGTLFLTVWISFFTAGRALVDRQAARIKVPKEVGA